MNNMKSLYIISGLLLLCNIAVGSATSFDTHCQWSGVCKSDTTDTVARRDSVTVDTLSNDTVAIDTLSKDSAALAVDSLSKDSVALDSLAADSAKADSLANAVKESLKREYVYFKEKQTPDPDQNKIKRLVLLYKKNISKRTLDGFAAAYVPWKGVFDGCERRTLDMYMDGIAIVYNMVSKDTIDHKYDKLTERREQMMELYDLAVDNLADLNLQIDRKRTSDTLSVAKLRAAQYNKFIDLWVLDSIYNSSDTLHNTYNDDNYKYWATAFYTDSTNIERLYPVLKDIVYCSDNNLGSKGYEFYKYYAGFFYSKYSKLINRSNKQYVNKYLKPEIDSIRAYVGKRYSDYMAAYPSYLSKDDKNYDQYMNNLKVRNSEIVSEMNRLDAAFIGSNDWPALEAMFNGRIAKEGMTNDIREEILRLMKGAPNSNLYFQALATIYQEEPVYENALKIAEYSYKAKRYNDAFTYYDKLINDHQLEIFELSDAEKFDFYLRRADSYSKNYPDIKSLSVAQCRSYIGYLQATIEQNPNDYRTYLSIGVCFLTNAGKFAGKNDITKRAGYMYAYEWLQKTKDKFRAQKSDADKYPGINLSDELGATIDKYISSAYSGLPTKDLLFMYGAKEGQAISVGFKPNGKDMPFILRCQN